MAAHYGDGSLPAEYHRIEKARPIGNMAGWVTVRAVFSNQNTTDQANVYAVLATPEGWKIDWESSVGYNPMSWTEFKATKPHKPQQFRMVVRLVDHYPPEFHGAVVHGQIKTDFWSLEVSENAGNGMSRPTMLTGYVKKETEDGKWLFNITRGGGYHAVTCLVRCPNPGDRDESLFYDNPLRSVIIDRVLSDGWLLE